MDLCIVEWIGMVWDGCIRMDWDEVRRIEVMLVLVYAGRVGIR